MRDDLDSILTFIGAESLTDEEFGGLTITDAEDPEAVYDDLLVVLESREAVSDARERLRHYYLAQGILVGEVPAGKSNIFIGAAL